MLVLFHLGFRPRRFRPKRLTEESLRDRSRNPLPIISPMARSNGEISAGNQAEALASASNSLLALSPAAAHPF